MPAIHAKSAQNGGGCSDSGQGRHRTRFRVRWGGGGGGEADHLRSIGPMSGRRPRRSRRRVVTTHTRRRHHRTVILRPAARFRSVRTGMASVRVRVFGRARERGRRACRRCRRRYRRFGAPTRRAVYTRSAANVSLALPVWPCASSYRTCCPTYRARAPTRYTPSPID